MSGANQEEWVYRISTAKEWDEMQKKGAIFGGDLDRKTGCIHLSNLNQVMSTLGNFFQGREDLYLLQIDTTKKQLLGELGELHLLYPELLAPICQSKGAIVN